MLRRGKEEGVKLIRCKGGISHIGGRPGVQSTARRSTYYSTYISHGHQRGVGKTDRRGSVRNISRGMTCFKVSRN